MLYPVIKQNKVIIFFFLFYRFVNFVQNFPLKIISNMYYILYTIFYYTIL